MPSNTIAIVHADGTRTEVDEIEGLNIQFSGRNSSIEIGEGSRFTKCRFMVGSNAHVRIGTTHPRGLHNVVVNLTGNGEGRVLTIGAGTSIEGARFALGGDGPRSVTIGENCLMSSGITFRPSDGHAIFDLATGDVINPAKPIVIGDHVWVGAGVTFIKGSRVPNDTVVGTGALVSRQFTEENTAVAGNPAKVVRTGIGWDRQHVETYIPQKPALVSTIRVTIEVDPEFETDPADLLRQATRIAYKESGSTPANVRFVERVRWDERVEQLDGAEPFDYLVFDADVVPRTAPQTTTPS